MARSFCLMLLQKLQPSSDDEGLSCSLARCWQHPAAAVVFGASLLPERAEATVLVRIMEVLQSYACSKYVYQARCCAAQIFCQFPLMAAFSIMPVVAAAGGASYWRCTSFLKRATNPDPDQAVPVAVG